MNQILELISFAKLDFPVEIRITEKHSSCVAEHEPRFNAKGFMKKHVIWVYVPELVLDARDFHTVIAHELIHAMQAEQNINEWHGEFFKEKAQDFIDKFEYLGYVFDPEIDKP